MLSLCVDKESQSCQTDRLTANSSLFNKETVEADMKKIISCLWQDVKSEWVKNMFVFMCLLNRFVIVWYFLMETHKEDLNCLSVSDTNSC